MAKTMRKTNVQFIRSPGGEEMAVLARTDYEALLARAADEDTGTARIVDRSRKAIADGREVVLPKGVVDRIAAGENRIKVLREWRGLIQGELAAAAGIAQNYLSAIETGARKGRAELLAKIARRLSVPLDLLVD
jgi:DNA-binding XRE family transcriptional regulator